MNGRGALLLDPRAWLALGALLLGMGAWLLSAAPTAGAALLVIY